MAPVIRKQPSGWEKRKKKKRIEAFIMSQSGALEKYKRKSQVDASTNATDVNVDNDDGNHNENDNVNNGRGDGPDDTCVGNMNVDSADTDDPNLKNSDSNVDGVNGDDVNDAGENIKFDIFDPRCWDGLTSDMIKVLVAEGPKRDVSIKKGPKDRFSRRFSATHYTRILPNKEKWDREWLVYSKELGKVFCFCCKIFRKGSVKGQLANEGFSNWRHLSTRLKEHEVGSEHMMNMVSWVEMRLRLKKNETIDKVAEKEPNV
uniref:zinc finger MYM-type protein 5-like n=1 Tax=Erigeron canadensis TaxID=72917 RepID=UPI001CB902E5|nr:zinc finger MYM-type protein 5-like [Erigeron canadensis]